MSITKAHFGTTKNGEDVSLYRLDGKAGAYAEFISFGAALRRLMIPDADGVLVDVALGYDSLLEYEENAGNIGAIVGRCANRIGGAEFTLDGATYKLAKNAGENHLHGGIVGFDKRVWSAEIIGDALCFSLTSPDGEEGYPGTLNVSVKYYWDGSSLVIKYEAETDKPTILNLTNHSYFNLDGKGDIRSHKLQINASSYTETGKGHIPTGVFVPVEGTVFDFTTPKAVGDGLDSSDEYIKRAEGYDLNFVLHGEGLRAAATLTGEKRGISMTVLTDQPGIQLYTANFLSTNGKNGAQYKPYCSLCLETQHFPDAIAQEHFPSTVLRPGERFESTTVFKF